MSLLIGLSLVTTALADDGETMWPDDSWMRVEAGADVGLQSGGKAVFVAEPTRWKRGSLAVGGLFSVHNHFWHTPGYVPDGLEYRGLDLGFLTAGTVGHVFRFAKRRVGLGLHAYTGVLLRSQHTEVSDQQHDLTLNQDFLKPFSETGMRMEVPVRLSRRIGLNLDMTIPLVISSQPGLPVNWLVSGPTLGLSVAVHL